MSIHQEEETLVSFDVSALYTSKHYLLHYKLSIPKFLPAPTSPMSARSLQIIYKASGIHCHQLHILLQQEIL